VATAIAPGVARIVVGMEVIRGASEVLDRAMKPHPRRGTSRSSIEGFVVTLRRRLRKAQAQGWGPVVTAERRGVIIVGRTKVHAIAKIQMKMKTKSSIACSNGLPNRDGSANSGSVGAMCMRIQAHPMGGGNPAEDKLAKIGTEMWMGMGEL